MRRVPSARSRTSPDRLSTFRCWDTAGRLTGSASASSRTGSGRSTSSSKIARRVGSPKASSDHHLCQAATHETLRGCPHHAGRSAVVPGGRTLAGIVGVTLKVGDKAPDFTLLDQDGNPFTLSESIKRRKVWHLIYFF